MSYAAIAKAISAKFTAEVAEPQSFGLVVEDNEPPDQDPRNTWYRLMFAWDPKEQLTSGPSGARRYRIPGRVEVQLSQRKGTGDGDMLETCDAIVSAFQNSPIADPKVCFEPPPHIDGIPEAVAGWHRRTLLIHFEAEVHE